MKSYIYQIRNLLDEKKYIGQTINIDKRQQDHFSYLRRGSHFNRHLQSAFNKYGERNFVFEILIMSEDQTEEELNILEIQTIAKIDKKLRYNISLGGQTSMKGRKHSPETLVKLSKSHMGKKASAETKALWSKNRKGNRHQAKLNENQVHEIKFKHLAEKKLTMKEIGELYGVCGTTISHIKNDKNWSNIQSLDLSETLINGKQRYSANKRRKNGYSKLTEAQVREIKFIHLVEKKLTITEIAKLYNVARPTISQIKLGKRWSHIKPLDTQNIVESEEMLINNKKRYNVYKKRLYTIEERAKMSKVRLGKKASAKAKARMSEVKQGTCIGVKNPAVKLTEAQVREIKFQYLPAKQLNNRQIGELYSVSNTTISKIKIGKSWAHIQPLETKSELSATLGGSI
jgi:group I intron endonuclease